ncbi:protein TolR [Moraxella nonliquefaciens]|uniref:protein TolR n=1 Tax=Moraxella nonliquefaciens TaxID=478 RepID=UPI000ADDE8CB|nr:protein TolR [Moraxella nonliquefaciens]
MKHNYTRAKTPLNSQMNVVPYIDVMLVLLIIFMITAPMLNTGVEVNLPSEKTNNITKSELTPIIVSLTKDGKLFVSYEKAIDQAISQTELSALLTNMAQKHINNNDNQLQVMIHADKDNSYEAVMHLMALAQRAGITKVGLLSHENRQPASHQ